jgi:hypothetical protein
MACLKLGLFLEGKKYQVTDLYGCQLRVLMQNQWSYGKYCFLGEMIFGWELIL